MTLSYNDIAVLWPWHSQVSCLLITRDINVDLPPKCRRKYIFPFCVLVGRRAWEEKELIDRFSFSRNRLLFHRDDVLYA